MFVVVELLLLLSLCLQFGLPDHDEPIFDQLSHFLSLELPRLWGLFQRRRRRRRTPPPFILSFILRLVLLSVSWLPFPVVVAFSPSTSASASSSASSVSLVSFLFSCGLLFGLGFSQLLSLGLFSILGLFFSSNIIMRSRLSSFDLRLD